MPTRATRTSRTATVFAMGLLLTVVPVTDAGALADRYASSPTGVTITSCTWSALSQAVAHGGRIVLDCAGTISVPSTIQIRSGQTILDGSNGSVTLIQGPSLTGRIIDVPSGATLTIDTLTVNGSQLVAATGVSGVGGDAGTNGSTVGGSGTPGSAAKSAGKPGEAAQGGAMFIAAGATVTIRNSAFQQNRVTGGDGGDGGFGGIGGSGASGSGGTNPAGTGEPGGNGASGGDASNAATGGSGQGGAIYNEGKLSLVDDAFIGNVAVGGPGGLGGSGGFAGNAGDGGGGGSGSASSSASEGGTGGTGGPDGHVGSKGGHGGAGGAGGVAAGGAVYSTGTLEVVGGIFTGNGATGGIGNDGGVPGHGGGDAEFPPAGGGGGDGGDGTVETGPGGRGGDATAATAGSTGSLGGTGGEALGGAIFSAGPMHLCSTTFRSDSAASGAGGTGSIGGGGGWGGYGGPGGIGNQPNGDPSKWVQGPNGTATKGGNGGNGSNGGNGGAASGGAVYAAGSLDTSNLMFASNTVQSGAAGAGGAGGPGGEGGWSGSTQQASGKDGAAGQPGKQMPASGPNIYRGSSAGIRRAASGACVDVIVAPTRSGVLQSGLSLSKSPGPVGFTVDEPDGDILERCLSGCRNFMVYVREAGGGSGVGGAKVTINVSPITQGAINKAQGGGYVCKVAYLLDNRDGPCGNPLTVTTETVGGAEGKVYLRYFPPAVWVPDGKPEPEATITAKTDSCGSSCTTASGTANVTVGPHLVYQRLGVPLSWAEKQALIEWAHGKSGNIIKNVKPIDTALGLMAKIYDTNKRLKALAKAVADLAKVGKLYGTWADFSMLEWFQEKFGVSGDGLINLGPTGSLTNQILKYVKDPIANTFVGWLVHKIFTTHTFSDEVESMLRGYGNWLWLDETNRRTQDMNVKLFEASYCKDSVCRSLAPGFGIHYNLLVTFSSKDWSQTTPYFKDPVVDTGYAAPTWLPAQCALITNAQARAQQCDGSS